MRDWLGLGLQGLGFGLKRRRGGRWFGDEAEGGFRRRVAMNADGGGKNRMEGRARRKQIRDGVTGEAAERSR